MDLGAGVDGAVAVVRAGAPGVAAARVAPSGPTAAGDAPLAASAGDHGKAGGPLLAVSAGRAVDEVVAAAPSPTPGAPAQPVTSPPPAQPVAAVPQPAPQPETAPASPPLVASVGGNAPGTSGVPIPGKTPEAEPEGCEGDEYVITVGEEVEGPEDEAAQFTILVQRFAADGESEFELVGDLEAVEGLADLLEGEGNCVQTVYEPAEAPEPALP